ncbi:MAG: peptidoglycan-binding protein, partial [Methanobrevibacter sp.]|nr:peptidoglycan-binding protein [Methanobrevibacter sp.]
QTDKEMVDIGQSVEFTPTGTGTGRITASIENVKYSIEIDIAKANSTLSVSAINYVYGGVGSTTVSFTGASGVEAEVVNQTKAVVKVSGNKITVSGLNPGTYTLKVTTIADANHNPVTKTVEITVNKAKTQLTASAKAFKTTDKTKAYTVVLKDGKGRIIKNALVYLKVNGITYKATTNAKGIATFKMAKLTKAGNYRATVTFNGNAFYDKATKSVQITVKSVFKTVSKGSKDNAMVKKIQVALKKNGYYLRFAGHYLKVDGIFHIYTELAVKQFQKAKGLKVTGKVDETTAKRLKII